MTPSRRTRDEYEAGDVSQPEVSESEAWSASRDARRDTNKRVRLSEETSYVSEDDLPDPATQKMVERNGMTIREMYESQRDATVPLEGGEDIEALLTQQFVTERRAQMMTDNQALECGVLQSITCINFMCHNKLHVALGPNINFIIGHNGSGKSAVLTALQLCLGGKAAATNRGQSLKNFVKEGRETATLIVKLKNAGPGSYKPQEFGNTIIIERQFSISGTSGFKIKNESGRIVSTKRAYLDDISDFYALQLDNPVNVLTQDMARQFLNSSTPGDKYRFFIKGVQLEQLDTDYTVLADNLTNIESKIETIVEDNKILADANRAAQEKYALTRNFGKLREKRRKVERQVAWVQVEGEERKLETRGRELDQAEQGLHSKEEACRRRHEIYDKTDQDEEEIQLALQEKLSQRGPLDIALKDSEMAEQAAKGNLQDHMSEQRQMHTELNVAKGHLEKLKEEIEEEYSRLQAVSGGSETSKLEEIKIAEEELANIAITRNEHRDTRPNLERELQSSAEKHKQAAIPVSRAHSSVVDAEKRLRSLQQHAPGDSAYHSSLSSVRRAIDRESAWQQKPVGPLGKHLKLNKSEWSSVLEKTFGAALNGFVVAHQSDQKKLTAILRSCGYHAQVYIVSNEPIDTRGNEPESHLDTILRILDIDSDLVRNSLIINQNIDQTILIHERQKLVDYMFQGQRVRNVKGGICLSDDRTGRGLRFSYGIGGAERADPVPAWAGSIRIQTNVDEQISMSKEAVTQQKQAHDEALRNERALRDQKIKAEQALNKHGKEVREHQLKYDRAQSRLQDLKDDLDALRPQDGKLDNLRALLEDAKGNLQSVQDQYDGSQSTRQEKQTIVSEAEKKRVDDERRLREFDEKVQNIRNKGETAMERKTRARRRHEEAIADVDDAKRILEAAKQDRDEQKQQVATFVEEATKFCTRVPVDRGMTHQSLERKLDEIHKAIREYEREIGGSEVEISRKAAEAATAYNRSQRNQADLENLVRQMTLSLMERRLRWTMFRSAISARARAHFLYLLSERGFKGSMQPDHRSKKLELMIQPTTSDNSGTRGSHERQTKTLSGGEKSFTTICLLLSLWDAMGSPIRCLDEFDVFMDSVNRDISMRMMIEAARRSVGRQYILITPQAMGNVPLGPDVKIIRLGDPERGQTALEFDSAQ